MWSVIFENEWRKEIICKKTRLPYNTVFFARGQIIQTLCKIVLSLLQQSSLWMCFVKFAKDIEAGSTGWSRFQVPDCLQKILYQTVLISAAASIGAINQIKKIEAGSSGWSRSFSKQIRLSYKTVLWAKSLSFLHYKTVAVIILKSFIVEERCVITDSHCRPTAPLPSGTIKQT